MSSFFGVDPKPYIDGGLQHAASAVVWAGATAQMHSKVDARASRKSGL